MQTIKPVKKLAIINDISGYGRCSLSVAIPIVSTMKIQACPVPTSVFSNHLGYPSYYSIDLTKNLQNYFAQWDNLQFLFDGIYCGYLHSSRQIQIAQSFILNQKAKNPDCMILIDPVMGDHGNSYKTITDQHIRQMRKMLIHADIITPNLTEACILTNTPYCETQNESSLFLLAEKLSALGAKKIVITGIPGFRKVGNYIYESQTEHTLLFQEIAGECRPGTGDIFASILSAAALRNISLLRSTHIAEHFISLCTQASHDLQMPVEDGVCFENFLKELIF